MTRLPVWVVSAAAMAILSSCAGSDVMKGVEPIYQPNNKWGQSKN